MYHSSYPIFSDTRGVDFKFLGGQAPFTKAATIHSTNTRQKVYRGSTIQGFGKLRNAFLRTETSLSPQKNTLETERAVLKTQTFQDYISLETNQDEVEKKLMNHFGLTPSKNPKPASSTKKYKSVSIRVNTAPNEKRWIPIRSPMTRPQVKAQSPSNMTNVKEIARGTQNFNTEGFNVNFFEQKYESVFFTKAPNKEHLKIYKFNDFDAALVPLDARRVLLEAIMRDYFLDLVPENSDYMICKNSQTQIYTIVFNGRLVPVCKHCLSVSYFEVSKDLGFRVLCSSQYCSRKLLHKNALNSLVISGLWPLSHNLDFAPSNYLGDRVKTPGISRLIQSGKYKKTSINNLLMEEGSSQAQVKRPGTTMANNTTLKTYSTPKFQRIVIKSRTDVKSPTTDDERPKTVLGLLTGGPTMAHPYGFDDFKGAPILQGLNEQGIFSRAKADENDYEEVQKSSREVKKLMKVTKNSGYQLNVVPLKIAQQRYNPGERVYQAKTEESHAARERQVYDELEDTERVHDNSLDDIKNMVKILTTNE